MLSTPPLPASAQPQTRPGWRNHLRNHLRARQRPSPGPGEPAPTPRHTWVEDLAAVCIGVALVSLGLTLYKGAGLLTGGVAGFAFLVHYLTGWPLGAVFFVLNLPFYALAARRLEPALLVKTIVGVALTSLLADLVPRLLTVSAVAPAYAGAMGGVLLGTGFLVLFRHRTSLGGFGILVLYLQDRFGWSAGKVQMAIDCCIVVCALFVVPPPAVAWSVLGALLLNLILAMNHRKDRYLGF